MSSIQGISGPSVAASYAPRPAPTALQAAKAEATETPQQERTEAARGAAEASESKGGSATVGSNLSVTA